MAPKKPQTANAPADPNIPPNPDPDILAARTLVSQTRSLFLRCLGYSHTFNPRNIEFFWYPSLNNTLFEVVGLIPNLIVFPQYFMSVDPVVPPAEPEYQFDQPELEVDDGDEEEWEQYEAEVDGEDKVDVVGPSTVNANQPAPALTSTASVTNLASGSGQNTVDQSDAVFRARIVNWVQKVDPNLPWLTGGEDDDLDDDEEPPFANITMSTEATVAQPNALERITDFAVLHLTMVKNPNLKRRYGGYRVMKMTLLILAEEKKFVSRSLRGADIKRRVVNRLMAAKLDVRIQAALHFRKDPNAVPLTAIAAAGPWWSSAEVSARPNDLTDAEFRRALKSNAAQIIYSTINVGNWTTPVRLDTDASNKRFGDIYKHLKTFQISDVI